MSIVKFTPKQQLQEMKKKTPIGKKLLEAEKKFLNHTNGTVAFLSDEFITNQFEKKVKNKEEFTIWRFVNES